MIFEARDAAHNSFSEVIANTEICDEKPLNLDSWASPLTTQLIDDAHCFIITEPPITALPRLIRAWISTFLDHNDLSVQPAPTILHKRLELRHSLESFVLHSDPIVTSETAVFACCWWAASVMLNAEKSQISLADSADRIHMQPRLTKCLRATDLANLWGARKGLLFWVVSVCHVVTTDRCLPLLTTALYAHFAHEMALDLSLCRAGVLQLRKLRAFDKLCTASTIVRDRQCV